MKAKGVPKISTHPKHTEIFVCSYFLLRTSYRLQFTPLPPKNENARAFVQKCYEYQDGSYRALEQMDTVSMVLVGQYTSHTHEACLHLCQTSSEESYCSHPTMV